MNDNIRLKCSESRINLLFLLPLLNIIFLVFSSLVASVSSFVINNKMSIFQKVARPFWDECCTKAFHLARGRKHHHLHRAQGGTGQGCGSVQGVARCRTPVYHQAIKQGHTWERRRQLADKFWHIKNMYKAHSQLSVAIDVQDVHAHIIFPQS